MALENRVKKNMATPQTLGVATPQEPPTFAVLPSSSVERRKQYFLFYCLKNKR